jgi:hypothetical protein
MAHAVLVQNSVQALNIDAYNRSVIATFDVDNGNVFNLSSLSSTAGEGEVWVASTPVTGALTNLWMAYEPEVVTVVSASGKKYKGIDPDPRDFYNVAGEVFTAFQPKVGDIITITADGIGGTKGANNYAVATNNTAQLQWAASAISGLTLQLLETTYISIADGSIGTQRTTAYRFVVSAVA